MAVAGLLECTMSTSYHHTSHTQLAPGGRNGHRVLDQRLALPRQLGHLRAAAQGEGGSESGRPGLTDPPFPPIRSTQAIPDTTMTNTAVLAGGTRADRDGAGRGAGAGELRDRGVRLRPPRVPLRNAQRAPPPAPQDGAGQGIYIYIYIYIYIEREREREAKIRAGSGQVIVSLITIKGAHGRSTSHQPIL
jgi:hypothetical protein